MNASSSAEDVSDIFVIRPDRVVIKTPIRVLYSEEQIRIENLFTFFSFRRIGVRLRDRIRRITKKSMTDFLCMRGYDVEPEVNIFFSEKALDVTIRFPEEELVEKKDATNVASHLFSDTCRHIPGYSIREYHLLPVISEYVSLFVLLMSYQPRMQSTLKTLRRILKYPFVTLPNDRGEYYSSLWEHDNLYSVPSIARSLWQRIKDDLCSRQTSTIRSRNLLTPLSKTERKEALIDMLAGVLKDVVHILDRVGEKKAIREILGLINKIISGEELTKDEIVRGVSVLSETIKHYPSEGTLKLFLDFLNNTLREIEFFETLEHVCTTRLFLRKLTRMLNNQRVLPSGGDIPLVFDGFFISGTVTRRRRKHIINLGGGKAIYISPREWRTIIEELNISDIDKAKIELKIVKRLDGKKSIVIDFVED